MKGISGFFSPSDIYVLDNITQNVAMEAGRNLLIDALRDGFSRDRYYRWLPDIYGFGKAPDERGLDMNAGAVDDSTTRLYIGATYKNSVAFLPSIVVKQTSMSYKPVSFNQNKWDFEYGATPIMDKQGNLVYINAPVAYSYVGLWESSFEVKITAKSLIDMSRLHDIVAIMLQSTYREVLQHNGLFVKSIRSSGEQTEDYGSNNPYYTTSISIDTLSEFRRRIPVEDTIQRFQVCVDYDILDTDIPPSSEIKIAVEPSGIFKVYTGADSFSLINETNLTGLSFVSKDSPVGDYELEAGIGEYLYFCAPARFDISFSVGYFTKIREIIIDGLTYAIYRSNATGIGVASFTVNLVA